jgi:DNA invertase Pin-like site-specific DNA recombinase
MKPSQNSLFKSDTYVVLGSVAQFILDVTREWTKAGLTAARARGEKGSRPKVMTVQKRSIAQELYDTGYPIADICRTLKISRASLYRALKTGEAGSNPFIKRSA